MQIERQFGKGKKKFFALIELDPFDILIDFKSLPVTAFICACVDRVQCFKAVVGEKGKEERIFVGIDWCINEWGGDKELVEALKIYKQRTFEELPELIAKWSDK